MNIAINPGEWENAEGPTPYNTKNSAEKRMTLTADDKHQIQQMIAAIQNTIGKVYYFGQ